MWEGVGGGGSVSKFVSILFKMIINVIIFFIMKGGS